jgi:hypothetical protein
MWWKLLLRLLLWKTSTILQGLSVFETSMDRSTHCGWEIVATISPISNLTGYKFKTQRDYSIVSHQDYRFYKAISLDEMALKLLELRNSITKSVHILDWFNDAISGFIGEKFVSSNSNLERTSSSIRGFFSQFEQFLMKRLIEPKTPKGASVFETSMGRSS